MIEDIAKNKIVFVVEGEKDAESLRIRGVPATTKAMGFVSEEKQNKGTGWLPPTATRCAAPMWSSAAVSRRAQGRRAHASHHAAASTAKLRAFACSISNSFGRRSKRVTT